MKLRSSRFSPRLLEPELLEELTVGRKPILERLVASVSAAISEQQGRYDLLVGPRGVGKSHMLGLVEARIRTNQALQERLVVVSLPEEFHPSSLLHLLARVLEELPSDPAFPPIPAQLGVLRGQGSREALETCVTMIRGRLRGRSLLLMFENLDTIFRSLGRQAQAQLRKILQTERGWSIFATARTVVALAKQTEPFHGTFCVEQLTTLTPPQCREMMVKLAHVHGRTNLETWLESSAALTYVRAAHHLVGGSPRVVAMLFHHLDPEHFDDLEGNFYRLAEELTPYFQEQMARLSAGQRPVMEFLAERWAPASVKEIAEGTFSEPTTVSTHLRALRRDRLVHATAVGKERFYEIAEPLHRIARVMKQDRKLGAALARIARIWALLRGNDTRDELAFDWLTDFCEGDSEYVDSVTEQLQIALNNGDPSARHYIDIILEHTQGHPRQAVALIGLMRLGLDQEALATAKAMTTSPTILMVTYIIWLAANHRKAVPQTLSHLNHIFKHSQQDHEIISTCLNHHPPDERVDMLLGLIRGLGPAYIATYLDNHRPEIPAAHTILLLLAAWLRGEHEQLLSSKHIGYLSDFAHNTTDISLVAWLTIGCLALENPVKFGTADPSLLDFSIPLWIASGRNISTLRKNLTSLASTNEPPPTLEHVLAADDNARAFARLGAETRAFIRDLFAALQLHELLDQLPPEPRVADD